MKHLYTNLFYFFKWTIFSFPLVLLCNCSSYDLGDEAPMAVPQSSVFPENVRWGPSATVGYVQNIIAYKCDNCHGNGKSSFTPSNAPHYNLSLLDKAKNLTLYTQLMKRSLARVFNTPSNPMPPTYGTPLTEDEQKALMDFLTQEGS